jgi:hypothetical protein
MARLVIELDSEQEQLLNELAASQQKSAEELTREALHDLLQRHQRRKRHRSEDPYEPLLKMIGLAEDGPADAALYHDFRPGEAP